MNFKDEKIKKAIEKEICNLLVLGEIKDPRVPGYITITRVTLSKDKHYSHIYFNINESEEKKKLAVIGLNNAKGFIQMRLAEKLQLRFTPKIEFRIDYEDEKANKVDDILKKISEEINESKNNKND